MVAPSIISENQDLDHNLLADLSLRLETRNLYDWIEQKTLFLARLGYRPQGLIEFTDALLAAVHVHAIREASSELSTLAQLRPTPDHEGYEIFYKQLRRRQRIEDLANQRFWIAHELAHTFWLNRRSGTALSPLQQPWGIDPTIEWLCNRAAAALLLPEALLQKNLKIWKLNTEMWPVPMERLPDLAAKFLLPVQMVTRRWFHDLMKWDLAVICLERCPTRERSDGAWRVRWDAVPRSGYWRAKTLYRRIVPLRFLPTTCGDVTITTRKTYVVELLGQWRGFLQQTRETETAVHLSKIPSAAPVKALCSHAHGLCYLALTRK